MNVLIVTRMWPTPDWPRRGPSVHREVQALRKLGVRCDVVVPTRSGSVRPYLDLALEMRRRLRHGDFDLVHAHYGYSAVPARMQVAVPLVITFHGNDLIPVTDDAGRPTRAGRLETVLSRQISRFADQVIIVAPHMAELQVNRNVRVIPHGVELDIFRPADQAQAREQLGLAQSRRYVLFAANPALTVKRYGLAAAAVEQLERRDAEVELRAVGDRPHDEIAVWMSAADVLLLTSITEGSPMVIKEAMACNLPVVSVPVGDVEARLRGVRNCHIVGPDPARLADALGAVLASGERSNGREFAREIDIMSTTQQVIDTYEEVLTRARRGRR
jgi:glycosyltransferase involved in cell wall biosynthesis